MTIKLSDHFTYKKLFRFTLPSVAMMVFISVYGIVDGFFVSNFVGKTQFSALNLIYPALMLVWAIGFMLGTGGSALVGKTLGQGRPDKANKLFSMFVYATVVLAILLGAVVFVFITPIARALGAEGEMLTHCVVYARILLLATPAQLLQFLFQSFFVTSEKPTLGFVITVVAGVANIVLDALFVLVFKWGLAGSAIATAASQYVGAVVSVIYFASPNTSLLRLGKPYFNFGSFAKACVNGVSEFLSNVSMSIVAMLYNWQLLKYAGEDGVIAYGVLMYVCMIFLSCFIGYSVGTAPVISYNYGAQNKAELQSIYKKSLVIVFVSSVAMFVFSELCALPLSKIFVNYDQELLQMTTRAFRIFAFNFIFTGLPIYASSFFTALNNGVVSALISFLRVALFQVVAVLVLPLLWQLDGIWISIVVAEVLAFMLAAVFLLAYKNRYGYGIKRK